ncbi:hypothetical protein QTA57_06665 [Fontisubflavum oceani]|uniref:hypothetical protein n=1 Tax=Fontisubflavum oceani TaxID=2978973 RepID=UPI0025B2D7B3|nr:hypothetical protein [Fontisubflavum oceani]WJY22770.1 hypothetical protein QTA57_06665 [Fontisubflavum oceani]
MWWSVVASAIAAGAALIIAFRGYARQRNLDRIHELGNERRLLYRRFSASSADLLYRLGQGPGFTFNEIEHLHECELVVEELLVSVPDEIANAVLDFQRSLDNYQAELDDGTEDGAWILSAAVAEQRRTVLYLMRKDTFANTNLDAELFAEEASSRLGLLRKLPNIAGQGEVPPE